MPSLYIRGQYTRLRRGGQRSGDPEAEKEARKFPKKGGGMQSSIPASFSRPHSYYAAGIYTHKGDMALHFYSVNSVLFFPLLCLSQKWPLSHSHPQGQNRPPFSRFPLPSPRHALYALSPTPPPEHHGNGNYIRGNTCSGILLYLYTSCELIRK